eukprot:439351-Alexandrium_andersonii.AAC.1
MSPWQSVLLTMARSRQMGLPIRSCPLRAEGAGGRDADRGQSVLGDHWGGHGAALEGCRRKGGQ